VRPPASWNLLDPDVLAWQQEGMPQPAFLRKLTEVRLIVEPAAAERAALRARPAELALLDAALRDMNEALARSPADYEAFDQADIRFHRAILQACDNDVLEQMSAMVYSALLVSFHATSRLKGRARASLPRHRAILEAIRAHQPRRAGAAMRRLVHSTAHEIEALPRKRSPRR
jgi:DNA-binding FadR family transcriptional regulator